MSDRFPKPYVNSTKVDRALMEYVPFDTLDIGARKSGLPKDGKKGDLALDHVGGTAGGSK